MDIPVLLALPGSRWEADLVAAFDRAAGGIAIVRRCVDLADLLAAAAVGVARAALVCPDLRRLDLQAVGRLREDGLAVIGVVDPGDEAGERRLRQMGVATVVTADAGADHISAAVTAAVAAARPAFALPAQSGARAMDAFAEGTAPGGEDDRGEAAVPGNLVAVWGPTGAPGRTTVAVTLADELAAAGVGVLLADADTYGGSVAQVLGLLDESPGLAAAARAANNGTLDLPALAALARRLPKVPLTVLTGIARADRWPELRPASLDVVWSLTRRLAAVTVVDCGFCLEQDEELTFDTAAPQRNGATLATLAEADCVLAVGTADPVGIHRLARGLADLRDVAPAARVHVVLTRVRRGPAGSDAERQVAEALQRFAGVVPALLVPADGAACDRAMLAGRTLREVAPESPARRALAGFAAELAAELGVLPAQGGRPAGLRGASSRAREDAAAVPSGSEGGGSRRRLFSRR